MLNLALTVSYYDSKRGDFILMGSKISTKIDSPKVVFINADGKSQGVISTTQARQIASAAGLDLVKVSENKGMPVCKLMDLGKWKFQQKKKQKKPTKIKTKIIKFSPNTSEHDLKYRAKNAEKFMAAGSPVRVIVKFSGREKEHMFETGKAILEKYLDLFEEPYTIEEQPQRQGNTIAMVITK